MEPHPERILANLDQVRRRIARAARRAGRDPDEVRLVAVTKTVGPASIRVLAEAGQTDIGENRPQAIRDRSRDLAGLPIRWHLIGRLQKNKVKYVAATCHMIHSLDSATLADRIAQQAAAAGLRADCLLQINTSGEEAKAGVRPEDARLVAEAVAALPAIRLAGLMTMAPMAPDPEAARPAFAALRHLRDRLNQEADLPAPLKDLSMGMTQDFEVAVEEGATLVRVGSALFG